MGRTGAREEPSAAQTRSREEPSGAERGADPEPRGAERVAVPEPRGAERGAEPEPRGAERGAVPEPRGAECGADRKPGARVEPRSRTESIPSWSVCLRPLGRELLSLVGLSLSMDYTVALQKRALSQEAGVWEQADNKRFCQGLESSFPVENDVQYTQLNENSMYHQNLQKHVHPTRLMGRRVAFPNVGQLAFLMQQSHEQMDTSKPCPRCLAGESGHINHMVR
ncbi:hypothetical protein chiPu_0000719 [Chiloscyllium punctatum]|uniref:Uncharacterized protein n=1 Tax=Chiloscyllium punctatum TaxID=137246 RepID=A0A401RW35_CHIPU|nr:hypothetical protein [Chiloscyllium punctatum]